MNTAGRRPDAVHVDVLGPIRVRGGATALRGRLQRGLLALLATADARGLTTPALVEALWGARPPRDPRHALQAQVSRLRKVLGAPDLVVHEAEGHYRLDRSGVHVDADRFVDLAESGIAAVESGDVADGADRLHRALALWRGPACDDPLPCGGLVALTARLEALRLRTLEHRVDADLQRGATTGLAAELRGLVSTHPLRERLWRALMLALHQDGEQAAALAVYRTARTALAEQAGLEPGPLLVDAHESLLRDRPQPRSVSDPPAGSPSRMDDVARPAWQHRLDSGPFVGRRTDRDGLVGLYGHGRSSLQVALVAGTAGVGKTRLAAHVATQLAATGVPTRYGRCDITGTTTLQPIVELLRQDLEATPSDDRRARLGRHPGELARLLPELAVYGTRLHADRETERRRLLAAITSWLSQASGPVPMFLVVEDLQWADAATLATLRQLVRSPDPVRGLLLVTYRPGDIGAASRVAAVLDDLTRDQSHVRRLCLEGLEASATAELFAAKLGRAPDAATQASLARRLHELTGGNPFHVIELARHVDDVLAGRRGLHHDGRHVPEDLGTVLDRLGTTPAHVRAV